MHKKALSQFVVAFKHTISSGLINDAEVKIGSLYFDSYNHLIKMQNLHNPMEFLSQEQGNLTLSQLSRLSSTVFTVDSSNSMSKDLFSWFLTIPATARKG